MRYIDTTSVVYVDVNEPKNTYIDDKANKNADVLKSALL